MKYTDIIKKMTLEEKAAICSGRDFWHLQDYPELGVPPIMVTDGPHGLRKQADKDKAANFLGSVPSTCFPTAAATACSWDRELLHEMGEAMAEEALAENVSVILGPGVNIKRSPLCGRNFEYFSEDPYLTGEMGTALINGIQSKGVGASLKHYAANNQEKRRMSVDAVVDERTLREIYLAGFEKCVKQAGPWTVMCSYNKLNGEYASENKRLLTDILRGEWGFDGIVMSDWGAVNHRVAGLIAGLDLEMPGSSGLGAKKIADAVNNGELSEDILDNCVDGLLNLIFRSAENTKESYTYGIDEHHLLARKIASQSMVLLKNDGGLLPLAK
ncbi:MAG: glycosyl hydrolase, partial [Oscillospiraceae bacterium]|nr:glycosyl hydrolase [Oscillospiraceae bacterium]